MLGSEANTQYLDCKYCPYSVLKDLVLLGMDYGNFITDI